MLLFHFFGYEPISVNAQELEPIEDVLAWDSTTKPYCLTLRDPLLGKHGYRKRQILVIPSSRAEWAVYLIRSQKDDPQIVFKIFEKPLWTAMMNQTKADAGSDSYSIGDTAQAVALAKLPKTVTSHVTPISVSIADLLEEVWDTMLDRVRYRPKNVRGLDGSTYYFNHWTAEKDYRSGRT